MSNGELTQSQYDLHRLCDWSEVIGKYNPLLAEQMRDLYALLRSYDKYITGLIGDMDIETSWASYKAKWIDVSSHATETTMVRICMDTLESMLKGHNGGDSHGV